MGISEKKMKIVIENYFKAECNINTTIHDAFEKGFRIGVQKGVQPVVHGEWIVSHIPDSMLWECNQCGFDCGAHSFNFCPKCGAKMNGKGADNEID